MATPSQQWKFFCIFAICLFTRARLSTGDDSMVPNYTADDFDTQLERGPHFVLFYAPWCGHCKKTFPAWEALGQRFNSDHTREATVAKVDCTVETSLCSTHNIMGYPTMKFFHEGQSSIEVYKGARDVDSFESFVIREIKEREERDSPSAEAPSANGGLYELSTETFPAHTELGDHFIKFYAPWCGHCQKLAPTWAELAKTYEKDQSFTIAKVDCVKERDICQKHSIRAYPTMLWFRNGQQLESYKGGRDLESLVDYVVKTTAQVDQTAQSDADKVPDLPIPSEQNKGDVISLDESNFEAVLARHDTVLVKFFVNWCGHCQALVPVYKDLALAYRDNERVAIAQVDCIENRSSLCDKFEVQGYPTLLLFRNGQQADEYSGPRDLDHLTNYVSEHMPHDEL